MNRLAFVFRVAIGCFLFAGAFVALMATPLGADIAFVGAGSDPDAFWRALLLIDTIPLALALIPITLGLRARLPLRGAPARLGWLPTVVGALVPASTIVLRLVATPAGEADTLVPAGGADLSVVSMQLMAANVSAVLLGLCLVVTLGLCAWCLGPDRERS